MKKLLLLCLLTTIAISVAPFPAAAATLEWDAPAGSVDGYLVEISDDEGATWAYNYTVAGDVTALNLDDKCAFMTSYRFRVSAFNAAGISPPCDPVSWTRGAYTPPPDNPLPAVTGGQQPGIVSGAAVQ